MSEFARWQQRFAAQEYVFGEAPNVFLAAQKGLLPKSGKALSVADGEGRNGVWLAQQGLDVTSVDFSPNAQAKARKLAETRGVSLNLVLSDLVAWNWPVAAFDVVVGIFFQFCEPGARAQIFEKIRQALKPGGLLLIQGYTPRQLQYGTGGPKEIERLYTRELLEREFASFSSLDIKEYDCEMHEGTGHGGMSAVIDLVGRK